MKQYKKLAKYLRGISKTLIILADEIDEAKKFDKDSEELLSKIGAGLLFESKIYTFKDNDKNYISNCCGAEMEGMFLDTEICPECKEHCVLEIAKTKE